LTDDRATGRLNGDKHFLIKYPLHLKFDSLHLSLWSVHNLILNNSKPKHILFLGTHIGKTFSCWSYFYKYLSFASFQRAEWVRQTGTASTFSATILDLQICTRIVFFTKVPTCTCFLATSERLSEDKCLRTPPSTSSMSSPSPTPSPLRMCWTLDSTFVQIKCPVWYLAPGCTPRACSEQLWAPRYMPIVNCKGGKKEESIISVLKKCSYLNIIVRCEHLL
jgi:hypothetical protein